MASGLPSNLTFTPMEIMAYSDGYLAIGVDGELQKLSLSYKQVGKSVKPFPTPIRNATILNDKLIATWLDSELMLARMASIDLNDELVEGVERSELRIRRTLDSAIHPAGSIWSHVLDAEPLAIASNETSFSFILWKKGIYTMTEDAYESWRAEEPAWKAISKLPRAQETVDIIMKDDTVEVWSRGGGLNRYDLESGSLVEQKIIVDDDFILAVYHESNNYLLLLNDSHIAMYDGEKITLKAKLSGPIQDASWDVDKQGWNICGWREIIFLSTNSYNRYSIDEIPIYHDIKKNLVLCNDAKWLNLHLEEE